MKKFVVPMIVAMFLFAGCTTVPEPDVQTSDLPEVVSIDVPEIPIEDLVATDDYSDLSVCGDFPRSNGGGPTSMYFVCRSLSDGECYYKKTYFEQIEGCDPEFDIYDYGKEECFETKYLMYGMDGVTLEAVPAEEDFCDLTLQSYFKEKGIE